MVLLPWEVYACPGQQREQERGDFTAVTGRAVLDVGPDHRPGIAQQRAVRLQGAQGLADVAERGVTVRRADCLVGVDGNIRDGELSHATNSLSELLGRPATPVTEPLRQLA